MMPGLEQLIIQCAPTVSPDTMAAIVQVESRGNPLALNVNGSRGLTRSPSSRTEAKAWAQWLVDHGYNIDVGLAQVNVRHLQRMGISLGDAFDPCINLRMGAKILTENYQNARNAYGGGQQALLAAISAYNTGNHKGGFQNGYVAKVESANRSTKILPSGRTLSSR